MVQLKHNNNYIVYEVVIKIAKYKNKVKVFSHVLDIKTSKFRFMYSIKYNIYDISH